MRTLIRGSAALAVVLVLGACTENGPTDPNGSITGVWRSGVPGDTEATLELGSDGTFRVLDAFFGLQQCSVASGTWTQTETQLQVRTTERDGVSVVEDEDVPYTLSGGTLVTQPGTADEEVWARFGSMPTCADYGWPSFAMGAEVDGVSYDFSDNPPSVVLEDAIAAGFLTVTGWDTPDGISTNCVTCRVLELEIFTELASPLVPGTYPIESFGAGGLRSGGLVRLDYPSTDQHYRTDEGDPGTQPASGQVILTTVTAERIEGTFEFVAYDGRAVGPPYPTLTVTNGYFRLSFD